MSSSDAILGLALRCDRGGLILEVLHNDLGIKSAEIIGRPFPSLITESSLHKALSFLMELKSRAAALDWQFQFNMDGKMILTHCAGLVIGDELLILVSLKNHGVHGLFDELTQCDGDQSDFVRSITKEQADLIRYQPEAERENYDELTRLNNDLVTLQRELAKKNAELERLNAEVRRLSIMDELTGIFNRRGFFEIGQREVDRAKRAAAPLSAIMLDLDHFKQVNDVHGHAAGDKVLTEVAARCGRRLRKSDLLGRYGGEEFAVLLPDTPLERALGVAESLRRAVEEEAVIAGGVSLEQTISLGVAAMNAETSGLDDLLAQADMALYRAKESGRNRSCASEARPKLA